VRKEVVTACISVPSKASDHLQHDMRVSNATPKLVMEQDAATGYRRVAVDTATLFSLFYPTFTLAQGISMFGWFEMGGPKATS